MRTPLQSVRTWLLVLILASAVLLGISTVAQAAALPVTATVETDPVHSSGDAADDAAIWLHPTDPSLTTIIATDKTATGGLIVYDLAGKELHFYADGRLNNVDVRYNFPLGARRVDIVAATNRVARRIDFYTANSDRTLSKVGSVPTSPAIATPRGISLYHSPVSGTFYAFVTDVGHTDQYELSGATGSITGRVVRQWTNSPTHTEGLVADDERAAVYLAVEDVGGVFRYGAEPGDGAANVKVDGTTETGGHIVQDVKGLAMYYGRNGAGYLIAISQGGNSFHVYDRAFNGATPNLWRGEFKVVAGNGIDEVTGIDGADVTNVNVGTRFPNGFFVTQDTANPGTNQNFKIVPWPSIAGAFTPTLLIDPLFDPRSIGAGTPPVDTTPPDTAIDSGPSGTVTSTSATFAFSSSEAGSTFACSLDGATYTACSSPTTYSSLAPGTHTFAVRATDAANNTDATPASRTWTIGSGNATTLTVPVSADTFARESAPSSNFGASTVLNVDGGTGTNEYAYFRFVVTGVAGTVTAAKLRAWVTNGTTDGPKIFATGTAWTELGLSWANRPAPLGAASDDKASVPSGAWVEYNVTPLVTANGTYGFVTVPTSTDGMDVSSREAANKPTLVLTVSP